jgi:uncharacterized membrane protein
MRYNDERLQRLEREVADLRARVSLLEAPGATVPSPAMRPAPRVRPAARVTPSPIAVPAPAGAGAPPRTPTRQIPSLDLEDLLGGRVLPWAGGVAVFAGVVFFLATAIRRGWIDEPTRVVLAYAGSTALLALGLYLYERRGRTQASLALVAASIGALYASTTAATTVYDLVDPTAGLLVSGLIGAVATALAVRWDSREIAALGIVGALLSPVLVGADTSLAALAFMAVALVSATAVLLWKRWDWLAVAAFVTSVPQLVAWLIDNHEAQLVPALVVLAAFWAVYAVAAIGFELRVPTARLRFTSASLVLADAIVVAGAGWAMLADADHGDVATGWVIGVALVHVALGAATFRGRISREVALLLLAVGIGLSAIGAALALDGPALVAAWSVEAVLLAWLGRRLGRARGYVAAAGFLALAAAHALALDAPPDELAMPGEPTEVIAVLLVAAAAAGVARLYEGPWTTYRDVVTGLALGGLAYLPAVAFEGVWVVASWAALAVLLTMLPAAVPGHLREVAPAPFVALAAAHTLLFEAAPLALRDGVDDLGVAAIAIALTGVAALVAAALSSETLRPAYAGVAAVGAVYLPSIAIVDLTATGSFEPGQTPQVLLSVFWSLTGLAGLVYGLVRDDRRLRLAGLGLLGLAAAKVAVYDLAELDEIYRVLSFVGLGLLLLAGAFAYQRLRSELGPEARS